MVLSDWDDGRVADAVGQLVLANKILTVESVLDAYGHVSVRHPTRPDRFLMSLDSPPVLAREDQVGEYNLDGELADGSNSPSYLERYLHASVYRARADVQAICHNHSLGVLPFCASPHVRFEIISHTACILEAPPALWDITDEFGPQTDLMVTDTVRGDSMARTLGEGSAVLMRTHGSTVVGRDVRQMVVRTCELIKNAQALIMARQLGEAILTVNPQEVAANLILSAGGSYQRQWKYYQWRVAQQGL